MLDETYIELVLEVYLLEELNYSMFLFRSDEKGISKVQLVKNLIGQRF